MHNSTKYNMKQLNNKHIHYLNLDITRGNQTIRTDIYHKGTESNIVIPNTSNHPTQQDSAVFRYMYKRIQQIRFDSILSSAERLEEHLFCWAKYIKLFYMSGPALPVSFNSVCVSLPFYLRTKSTPISQTLCFKNLCIFKHCIKNEVQKLDS
jgi:hypothetical protein